MTERRVQAEVESEHSAWFLPVAILAMGLLLVAIALSEDSVAPIDVADDPGPILDFPTDPIAGPSSEPTSHPPTVEPQDDATLGELIPGFDGTLHVWTRQGDNQQLLVWSDQVAAPRPMELPAGTVSVDLNSQRVKTLVVTAGPSGRHVLWLGDRNRVEPVMILDEPANAVWHSSKPDLLALSRAGRDTTTVVTFRVEPGNVLVEQDTFEIEAGRTIEWVSDEGIALASRSGLRVGVWLTYDGTSTTYSRHVTQPGGRPIFDICTGVPCRPTVRMYLAHGGEFVVVGPEVVQVTADEAWEVVSTANGAGVRRAGFDTMISIPVSGLNAWSHDSRWMVFEAEAFLVERDDRSGGGAQTVTHPLAFLDMEREELFTVPNPDGGEIEGLWLP